MDSNNLRVSGLSGNGLYCAHLLGYAPGNLLVGNSVFSLGVIGSIRSSIRTAVGGEIVAVTNMIAEGRRLSFDKFNKELTASGGSGAIGVKNELVFHPGNIEFLTIGSAVSDRINRNMNLFSTSADAQELFCQWDGGYQPVSFVFGNVAYSIGIVKGVFGGFKKLIKGEVKQYSDIFNSTRNLALQRITDEAKSKGANSVIGINVSILPIGSIEVQEMVMLGTASFNPQISNLISSVNGITSSNLTAEETWNITKMNYIPLKLVLGTSVYSLGFVGGIKAALGNLVRGEINALTDLIYGAREESINKVKAQATQIGADDVLGIKNYIYDLGGGLVEFLSVGSAVKKVEGISTNSPQLPPQAITRDRETFIDLANIPYGFAVQKNV